MLAQDAEAAFYAVGEARAKLPKRRRWSWRTWAKVESRTDRLQMELAYPRFIGAAENYLLIHLTRAVKPKLLDQVAPPASLDDATRRLRAAARSFPTLVRAWGTDLGTNVENLGSWPDLMRCRDLRHILIHRLGRWEPGLDPKPRLADRIAALGRNPQTYRGAFPLALDDCSECADLSLAFVREAEAELGRP